MPFGTPTRILKDADGNPMVMSNGEPIPQALGLARYHFVYGDPVVTTRLLHAAGQAGAALRSMPLPEGVFERGSLFSRSDDLRWFYTVHEIARRHFPGSPLKTRVMAYNTAPDGPRISIDLTSLAIARKSMAPDANIRIEDPPSHTFSHLPDIVEASLCAIDVLIELAERTAHQPDQVSLPQPSLPAVRSGFLRLEGIRENYPHLEANQLEAVRKRLERWLKKNEDQAILSDEDPDTGKRRYAYPAEIVNRFVNEVLKKSKS